jgi:hypothetical protein
VSGRAAAVQTPIDAAAWWQQHDQRVYQCIKLWVEQWWEPQKRVLIDAVGQVFGEHRASVRETITNLKERVIRLETTSNFEERFTRLAHEVKRGSEIPQGELLEKIEALQRQLDDLKRVAAQPGPQGPPGKDGKLPIVKVFQKDTVYYTGDVVICDGSTYQALRDTGQNVNQADWVCLARAGRDGLTPTIRGTYDAHGRYKKLDIVASDGASFIAKRDNTGICPGDGWQLLSRQGRSGRPGETGERGPRGEKGERGEPGPSIVSWQIDRERYRASPLMSDGTVGPMLELREFFEQFLRETS